MNMAGFQIFLLTYSVTLDEHLSPEKRWAADADIR